MKVSITKWTGTAPGSTSTAERLFGKYGVDRGPGWMSIRAGRVGMSMDDGRKASGMGDATIPTMNTDAVRAYYVGPSSTDWWLDAALVPHGIDAASSPRAPDAVKQVLQSTGASVSSAAWGTAAQGTAGKIYVVWKPNAQYNAVDYANIAERLFKAAAEQFAAGSQIVMPRYRVKRIWPAADLYVYPTGEGIPASAPELAKSTLPGDIPPDPPSNESSFAVDRTFVTVMPVALAVTGGVVALGGVWWWLSHRSAKTVTTNPRRRMARNATLADVDRRLWSALGTLAHNRQFTRAEFRQHVGARRDADKFLDRLIRTGMIERVSVAPVRYYPTALGWERLEAELGMASNRWRGTRKTRIR